MEKPEPPKVRYVSEGEGDSWHVLVIAIIAAVAVVFLSVWFAP